MSLLNPPITTQERVSELLLDERGQPLTLPKVGVEPHVFEDEAQIAIGLRVKTSDLRGPALGQDGSAEARELQRRLIGGRKREGFDPTGTGGARFFVARIEMNRNECGRAFLVGELGAGSQLHVFVTVPGEEGSDSKFAEFAPCFDGKSEGDVFLVKIAARSLVAGTEVGAAVTRVQNDERRNSRVTRGCA